MESIIFCIIKCDVKMYQIVMVCYYLGYELIFISEINWIIVGGCKMMGILEGNKLYGWIFILFSFEYQYFVGVGFFFILNCDFIDYEDIICGIVLWVCLCLYGIKFMM